MKSSCDLNTRHAACDCAGLCTVRKARATNVVSARFVAEGAVDRSELLPARPIPQPDLTTGQSRVDVATVYLTISRIATTQIRLVLFRFMLAALVCSIFVGACGGGSNLDSNGAVSLADAEPFRSRVATPFDGRAVIGFQGWYGCPGDLPGNNVWFHWFNGMPSSKTMLTDMLPDTSIFPPSSLCKTGLVSPSGSEVTLFTDADPEAVLAQFKALRARGDFVVSLQRFVVELAAGGLHKARVDRVLDNAIAAANATGTSFYINYDISGADPSSYLQTLRDDWTRLASPGGKLSGATTYIKSSSGLPVLGLWGFGFSDRPARASDAQSIAHDLRTGSGSPKAWTLAGVPAGWAKLSGDSLTDPAWIQAYAGFDAISPWGVGAFTEASTALSYFSGSGFDLATSRGQAFLPTMFPGFSRINLMAQSGISAPANEISRRCGSFFEQQIEYVVSLGFESVFVAMLDEFDESTAMLPALTQRSQFPVGASGAWLSIDGCSSAPDFYMGKLSKLAQSIAK